MGTPIKASMVFQNFTSLRILNIIGLTILIWIILGIPALIFLFGPSYLDLHFTPTTNELINTIQYNLIAILTLITALSYLIGLAVISYLIIKMILAIGFLVDKKIGPWQSIKMSFRATRGNFWGIFGLMIILCLIIMMSIIPLGIGLIWALPYAIITYGVMYKNLLANVQ
jgi:uncharacterized membrane protein